MARPALESDIDLAAMWSTDEFAVDAVWSSASGDVELPAIMDAGHVLEEIGAVAVTTRAAVIHVMDHALPADAAQGDRVAIDGEAYVVRDLRPDGTGVTMAVLERG